MGEYFTVKADNELGYESRCQLGTGYDWRYTRRIEAEYLANFDAGFSTDIAAVLRCRQTIYRFPFPWEDYDMSSVETVLAQIKKRNIEASYTLPVPPKLIRHMRHREIKLRHQWPSGGGPFHYFVPCPFSKEFQPAIQSGLFRISEDPAPAPALLLFGEIFTNRQTAYTLFSCGYCQSKGGFHGDQLASLHDYERIKKDLLSTIHTQVIKRLQSTGLSCHIL